MSDFPFKKGDLISIKTSFYNNRSKPKEGVIIECREDGWFDVLIGGVLEQVHRNYIVTPKIQKVKITGGIK